MSRLTSAATDRCGTWRRWRFRRWRLSISIIHSNQKLLYDLLLRHSAAALLDLGRDHKNLGAELGLLAVLQTWTRDLRFHPHVHCLVPAGGLSVDGLRWVHPNDPAYFLPQAALAMRLRTRLLPVVGPSSWLL